MSIGLGVFLGSAVIAAAILFAATKDRWNWGGLWRRLSIGCAGVLLLLVATIGAWWALTNGPKPLTTPESFLGLSIGMSLDDVLFLRGEPRAGKDDGDTLVYTVGSVPQDVFWVEMKDETVSAVVLFRGDRSLLGVRIGDLNEDLLRRLGQPSEITSSEDKLHRWYSYTSLGVAFGLGEGRVERLAIFDPAQGDYGYRY